MGEYDLDHGYPAVADVETDLAAWGIEIPKLNDPEWFERFEQCLWGLLNSLRGFMGLSVWCPTTTTINVRSGSYQFKGETKTFTAGSAIDPTNNDTTYVWMQPDGTIGTAVDGTGWPATEHIRLAEVDVDADGVITDVRDLRGRQLFDYIGLGVDRGTPMLLTATLVAGNTVAIYTANAPFKFRVLDAWSVATSADGGTWKLTDGTNDITNAVTVTGTDKTVNRAGTIDDAEHEIAAAGSLSVVGDGANADVIVYILIVPVP